MTNDYYQSDTGAAMSRSICGIAEIQGGNDAKLYEISIDFGVVEK
jgi:hypothetical protein